MWVIYNPETKSVESAANSILINVPEWETDSAEALESWLEDYWHTGKSVSKLLMFMDEWSSDVPNY